MHFQKPIFIENLVSIGCKETRDEFEDPDEEVRRIFIGKLFTGANEWNFGLFLQEIFKNEYRKKEEFIEQFQSNLPPDEDSIDYQTFKETLDMMKNIISKEKFGFLSDQVFSTCKQKPQDRKEIKRKLFFIDIDGLNEY